LSDYSDGPPSLATGGNLLFLAWKSKANVDRKLNFELSSDGGQSFRAKHISNETSEAAPVLASHNGTLFVTWRGDGDTGISIARVPFESMGDGDFVTQEVNSKQTPPLNSYHGVAMCSHAGVLFLAYVETNPGTICVTFTANEGVSFSPLWRPIEQSDRRLALASNGTELFIAWKTARKLEVNVAKLDLEMVMGAVIGVKGFKNPVTTLPVNCESAPTLAASPSVGPNLLYLGWRGDNAWLHLTVSHDGGQHFRDPNVSGEGCQDAPALVWFDDRCYIVWGSSATSQMYVGRTGLA
jgi:hypothetical protein